MNINEWLTRYFGMVNSCGWNSLISFVLFDVCPFYRLFVQKIAKEKISRHLRPHSRLLSSENTGQKQGYFYKEFCLAIFRIILRFDRGTFNAFFVFKRIC